MPRTESGEVMDIIINMASVISRMNLGQLQEIQYGNVAYFAKKKLQTMVKENKSRKEIEDFIIKLYKTVDNSKEKSLSAKITKNLKSLSDSNFKSEINRMCTEGIHLIAPPFQCPKVNMIQEAGEFVGSKFSEIMHLPEYGPSVKTKHPVEWGIMYIQKLEHIADIKITSRNIGRSVSTTMEPTKGKARAGGQKFGEQDTWAILGYDATTILKDFWAINGDNKEVQSKILSEIYINGQAKSPKNLERGGAGKMFDAMLIGMGLDPNAG